MVIASSLLLLLTLPATSSSVAQACGLEPPERAALAPTIAARRGSAPAGAVTPSDTFMQRGGGSAAGPIQGALTGKTVYLSAGHGLTWTAAGWRTQRGNTNGIVEDLVSIEAVDQYLVPYLHAMGAYVVTVREPDLRRERVIVDDDAATLEGAATEGPSETGWGEVTLPIVSDATYPFEAGGARSLVAGTEATGELVYAPVIPSTGYWNVYASWVQGADRAADAHWIVRHSGGETHFRLDQRRHGSTWVLLGEFHFEVGAGPEAASVAVLDDSRTPGAIVSADAVRWGGGEAVHDRGGGTSGRPMYEHAARYYTQWNGAPSSVFAWISPDADADVSTRSRFAAWEHEAGEDAVYLAWHTNAPNPNRGTSSYTYGSSPPPGPLSNFSGAAGSRQLQDAVHAEIVDDLRAAWDPEWIDEGRFTAYFGEVNPSHNDEMPSVLVEVAYHDTPTDADQLRDPRFRRIAARAMAQGIARYFAQTDGTTLVLPPEPPVTVSLRNDGAGGLEAAWTPVAAEPGAGDPPEGYLVQVSTNGYGFDEGTPVRGTTHVLEGLASGDTRFVRIVATNAGGRSLPSQVVGASVAASGDASVLVVGGFDRIDAGLLLSEDLSEFALAQVQRMWLRRINDGSYAPRHGLAIAAAGFSFDGATDDAIDDGSVGLTGYQAVDWFSGEDSTGDLPLSPLARDALADYLDDGGRLLVSGSELAWALDEHGTPDEASFYRQRLHAHYVGDDAETYEVQALEGPLAEVAAVSFSDPTAYDPRFPDVLDAEPGATVVLAYDGAPGIGAGVAWGEGDPGERGVTLGFPFETVAGAQARADLMAAVLAFFDVQETPGPDDGDSGGADATGDDGQGDTADTGAGDGDDDVGSDTGSDAPADGEDDSGCACHTASDPGYGAFGLSIVFVLGLARSRRRARWRSTSPIRTQTHGCARIRTDTHRSRIDIARARLDDGEVVPSSHAYAAAIALLVSGCYGGVGSRSDGGGEETESGSAGDDDDGGDGADTGEPAECASTQSPGAPVPMRRLTAAQVRRTAADILGVSTPVGVADEKLFTFKSNVSSSVDFVGARGYLDFAEATVLATDLSACAEPSASCTTWLFDDVGRRLFRRALTPGERAGYEELFEAGSAEEGGSSEGARWVLEAMLQSPSFLYMDEVADPDGYLDDHSMASRLALTLWGANPDAELLDRAAAGELSTPEQIQAEAARLLADPRSVGGLTDFVDQWLRLDRINDPDARPDLEALGPETLAAMRAEPVAMLSLLIAEEGDVTTLFTSTETAVSPLLAPLYGDDILDVGETTSLDPTHRAGMLSLPGVMAALSHAEGTSPTLRGYNVLANMLCTPPPPPPPGLDVTLPDIGPDATTRERLEAHFSDPSCASCHAPMDGMGFAFESLDWLGRHRDDEHGKPIDDSSTFPLDGEQVTIVGPVELATVLAASESAPACIARQWASYAAGTPDKEEAACLVEQLAADAREPDGLRAMILGTVASDWYRKASEVAP